MESVNSATFAADPAPAPSRTQAMPWKVTRSVSTGGPAIEIPTTPRKFSLLLKTAGPRRFGIEGLVQIDPEHSGEE